MEAPKLIEVLGGEAIVLAACGRNHTLALTGIFFGGKKPHNCSKLAEIDRFFPKLLRFVGWLCFFRLAESGSVFAFGENKMGQLGLGNQTDAVPSPTQVSWLIFFEGVGAEKNRFGGFCIGGKKKKLKKKTNPSRTQIPFKDARASLAGTGFISSCGGKIKGKNLK